MKNQMIFIKRYEIKYLLTSEQRLSIQEAMKPYMQLDDFGHSVIRNIYYDTDNYRLVRRSIEKPVYKEKLRMRSYRKAGKNDNVFLELKKKYQSVVYKRRILLP
uniref:VTC domain-containing protein n=1 Tax=Coprococcus catus TaxID=116085 RepID=UPI0022E45741|nr:VTC domain-containing protein [Coprococcus catus]